MPPALVLSCRRAAAAIAASAATSPFAGQQQQQQQQLYAETIGAAGGVPPSQQLTGAAPDAWLMPSPAGHAVVADVVAALESNPAVPTVFRWEHGGGAVYITGTFNGWSRRVPMHRSGNDFVYIASLARQKHAYKFIVDDEWRFAPDQPTVADAAGNINNYIDLSTFSPEAEAGGGITSQRRDSLPGTAYGHALPDEDEYTKEPPLLPPHLRQIILNGAPPDGVDPLQLPVPLHVTLGHLFCTALRDGLMVQATSVRYRRKFATNVFYTMMPAAPPVGMGGGPQGQSGMELSTPTGGGQQQGQQQQMFPPQQQGQQQQAAPGQRPMPSPHVGGGTYQQQQIQQLQHVAAEQGGSQSQHMLQIQQTPAASFLHISSQPRDAMAPTASPAAAVSVAAAVAVNISNTALDASCAPLTVGTRVTPSSSAGTIECVGAECVSSSLSTGSGCSTSESVDVRCASALDSVGFRDTQPRSSSALSAPTPCSALSAPTPSPAPTSASSLDASVYVSDSVAPAPVCLSTSSSPAPQRVSRFPHTLTPPCSVALLHAAAAPSAPGPSVEDLFRKYGVCSGGGSATNAAACRGSSSSNEFARRVDPATAVSLSSSPFPTRKVESSLSTFSACSSLSSTTSTCSVAAPVIVAGDPLGSATPCSSSCSDQFQLRAQRSSSAIYSTSSIAAVYASTATLAVDNDSCSHCSPCLCCGFCDSDADIGSAAAAADAACVAPVDVADRSAGCCGFQCGSGQREPRRTLHDDDLTSSPPAAASAPNDVLLLRAPPCTDSLSSSVACVEAGARASTRTATDTGIDEARGHTGKSEKHRHHQQQQQQQQKQLSSLPRARRPSLLRQLISEQQLWQPPQQLPDELSPSPASSVAELCLPSIVSMLDVIDLDAPERVATPQQRFYY